MREPRADTADIAPVALAAHGQDQRSKIQPRPSGRSEPDQRTLAGARETALPRGGESRPRRRHGKTRAEPVPLRVEGVLEKLEARDAVFVQGNKLAVDDGIVLDLLQSLGNWLVVVAYDQAAARIQRHAALLDAGDQSEAVSLGLEHPFGAVERRVDERGQHGLQLLGNFGRACHRVRMTLAGVGTQTPILLSQSSAVGRFD
jgi:hypothetical protein